MSYGTNYTFMCEERMKKKSCKSLVIIYGVSRFTAFIKKKSFAAFCNASNAIGNITRQDYLLELGFSVTEQFLKKRLKLWNLLHNLGKNNIKNT